MKSTACEIVGTIRILSDSQIHAQQTLDFLPLTVSLYFDRSDGAVYELPWLYYKQYLSSMHARMIE